jgi:DNA-binding NarL/FixJ family response regulator
MLRKFIDHLHYEVVTASDSTSAFKYLKTGKYDLLITDLENEYALYHICEREYPEMKVILFTGFGSNYEEKIKEALSSGVACCLYKPFKFNVLENAIKCTIG